MPASSRYGAGAMCLLFFYGTYVVRYGLISPMRLARTGLLLDGAGYANVTKPCVRIVCPDSGCYTHMSRHATGSGYRTTMVFFPIVPGEIAKVRLCMGYPASHEEFLVALLIQMPVVRRL